MSSSATAEAAIANELAKEEAATHDGKEGKENKALRSWLDPDARNRARPADFDAPVS